jgi:DNA-binding transcriptional regulator GbsR (MarR family)
MFYVTLGYSMEQMPTIAEFAKTLGVSKSTVVNKIKELDLRTVIDPTDKRRSQRLPKETCSVLADKLAKTKPQVEADETKLLDLYQAQIEPLKSANASLERQVEALIKQIEVVNTAATDTNDWAQKTIDELKAQVDILKRENAQLRNDLAMARALEGFHWPWEKDKIRAQYLLPAGETRGTGAV